MIIEDVTIDQAFVIKDIPQLDPIMVIIRDHQKGNGEIIIRCYGKSWTYFWGAMGERRTADFFASCSTGYLVGKLGSDTKKADLGYLIHIVEAVKAAINFRVLEGNCHEHKIT